MPRDALATRKLLAKIDRHMDIYEVADRLRQALYDESDNADKLEKRINLLEDAERNRLTETGVQRAIEADHNSRAAQFGGKLFWACLAIAGMIFASFMSWFASMAYRGAK